MTDITRNKWQARVFTVVIFLLGLAAGIMSVNAYRWVRNRRPPDRFEQMASRLQLNDEQKTKVRQIFGDTRQQLQNLRKESEPRVNDIRQQADQRLQQILTADQWQRFQQLRNETRGRRDRGGRSVGQ